ncbi:MAG: retention module-containing protein, partial [Marinomonas colpomeniae]
MSDSQTTSSISGTPIGVVTKLTGSVVVQSVDGQDRIISIGDSIYFGETVLTGSGSSVTITFVDNTEVVIGGDAIVEITDEIYNAGDAEDLVADSVADIEALQAAILAGDDPTLTQEAPAAGEVLEDEDTVGVSVARTAGVAGVDSGFETLPGYGFDTDTQDDSEGDDYIVSSTSTNVADAVAGTVTINSITSDDIIDAAEAKGTVTVSGSATGGDISSGDLVSLVVNGTRYVTSVGSDGSWSIGVTGTDLAADTEFDVVVFSSNSDGNTVESASTSTHTIDQTPLLINLDIDQVTDDATINASEAGDTITITGTVTGDDFESGIVTLVINDVTYTTTVGSDGVWSVDVAGSDLEADANSEIDGSVSVVNNIGQEGDANTTESYFVDTTARAVIRVNGITDDDIINAEESEGTVTVSGSVGFDVANGDIVSMTINGVIYTAVVASNLWSVAVKGSDLAADTSFTVTVTGEDSAGNSFTASTTSTHTVDVTASAPTIAIAGDTNNDGVYNAAELGTDGT